MKSSLLALAFIFSFVTRNDYLVNAELDSLQALRVRRRYRNDFRGHRASEFYR
jgi:hypothetical protein